MPRKPPVTHKEPTVSSGRGGRPPKPLALHRIEGTFRPERHNARAEAEPHAPGNLKDKPPPEWMTPAQRELWTEALLDAPLGVLRRIDWAVFANYIEVVDRHAQCIRAQQTLDRGKPVPFLLKGAGGYTLSPYFRAVNSLSLIMLKLQTELGFTPLSRARFQQREPDTVAPPDASGWDNFTRLRVVQGGKRDA